MEPCLILVGMMGSGKTVLGRLVAEQMSRPFKDTDQIISDRLCQPISSFFQRYGEAAFREHETRILQELQPDGSIIATGGGIVLREQNWTELRRLGTTVYLSVEPEILITRLTESNRKRPLLQVENWENKLRELVEARAPLYRQADIHIQIQDEDLSAAATKIVEFIREAS